MPSYVHSLVSRTQNNTYLQIIFCYKHIYILLLPGLNMAVSPSFLFGLYSAALSLSGSDTRSPSLIPPDAVASPMVFSTPQQLAALWFAQNERATATSMAAGCGCVGFAVSNLGGRRLPISTVLQIEGVLSAVLFIVTLSDQIWYREVPPLSPSVSSLVALEAQTERSTTSAAE